MGKSNKKWMLFKRVSCRWKLLGSAFKWRRLNLQLSFIDNLIFRIASVLEAIVLVATLCFFYLCCGCHF
ncbi:hypothetical protein SLEP1_g7739 [Rubroshorea leprosula]|uniref:Transmembrane protein n=1 Tax=Rubroshorea leprosula TaxID=152421 RepID=A0AAV5I8H0_9ROSI|nr:hypothetical protein SLEP1_g7739 [Rubroshorea leprosula]